MKFRLIAPLAVFAVISCNDNLKVQEQTVDLSTPEASKTFEVSAPSESPASWGEKARAAEAPAAPAPASTGQTAPGMNPPHGQPGHRCDIAVGAPLNGAAAPAKPAGQTISMNPNGQVTGGDNANVKITRTDNNTKATTTSTVPANSQIGSQTTAPGMNPPHGQPGHKCDIAVGAPLK